VKRFLGEGGKKRVYLAHDSLLDRDVAFALIKTEGLDEVGRERIRREAQAMGRLGAHPHVVSVFDLGETEGQPFIVTELMGGGDVEGLIEEAPDHRVPLADAIRIADEVCRGLEFAHSKQIVHRDLKPGNVWLTADGTAKIGDFGLAVATDRLRLTQPGLMVGTVSYMPPEQAMGGEVTPLSDLYSLGAMLYELVTGRPPFVGDESVAIITQHLNTPPVAPSWHVPDLPPGVEALILRLLEKDPSKRPTSAGEVRKAFAALPSPARRERLSVAEPVRGEPEPPGTSPLYRSVFVGREFELRQLQAAFDAALSGQGSLAMVVGEPGIGKTSLSEQLATYVAVRGGRTLVGHCYEEGSLSLPYLPFVEAMRTYVLERPPEALREELGTGAQDVARIVSEVQDRLQVHVRPPGDPGDDRWRLLQAVAGFLRNASQVQPLLLVLEDLHDADRGTLDLLVHLARNLEGSRLVVVGTYRDVEVDRVHPLSGALAELRRTSSFQRVSLRGLTVDEVQRMMNVIRGQDVPWGRAEAIHRQTEGNPLFVQEVLRYLVEEGLVVRREGRYVRASGGEPDAGIPEGLRDVIGKRLTRLSAKTNQVLSVAAVIGRDFRLDVLQRVVGLPEDDVIEALDEATDRAVVEVRSELGANITYRFAHAFFRQALYEEISPPRRIRWHQQVARALEQVHARRREEHASELAEHFAHSSDPEDLEKAVRYGELAAGRALGVHAYGEAVRHLERALEVQEVLDPDDRTRRCDLLLALGEAQMPFEAPRKVADVIAPEALALAEVLDDRWRAARACHTALEALHRDSHASAGTPEFRQWAERADRYAPPGTTERAHTDIALGRVQIAHGERAEGVALLRNALALARDLQDPELLFTAAWQCIWNMLNPRHWQEAVVLAREFSGRARNGVKNRTQGQVLEFCGAALLHDEDREGAERAIHELSLVAEQTRDASNQLQALSLEGMLAAMDGRLEEAVALGDQLIERAQTLGMPQFAGLAIRGKMRAQINTGSPVDLIAGGRPLVRPFVLALAGEHQAARDALASVWPAYATEDGAADPLVYSADLALLLETAIVVGDGPVAGHIAPVLADTPGASAVGAVVCYQRLVAESYALLGDADRARAHYQRAIDSCTRIRFRPELALCKLGLAELLLAPPPPGQGGRVTPDDRQHAEAQAHLDFAIAEFRAMKMQPALERALRHKGLLHA
jgi:tetratricopeptide (TPR) repeat protein